MEQSLDYFDCDPEHLLHEHHTTLLKPQKTTKKVVHILSDTLAKNDIVMQFAFLYSDYKQ